MNSFWISGPINHIYTIIWESIFNFLHIQKNTSTATHQKTTQQPFPILITFSSLPFRLLAPTCFEDLSCHFIHFFTFLSSPAKHSPSPINTYILPQSTPYYFCSPYIPLHTPETLLPYRSCLLSRLRLHYHHRSFASDGRPFFVQHSHPSVLYSQKRPRLWC